MVYFFLSTYQGLEPFDITNTGTAGSDSRDTVKLMILVLENNSTKLVENVILYTTYTGCILCHCMRDFFNNFESMMWNLEKLVN